MFSSFSKHAVTERFVNSPSANRNPSPGAPFPRKVNAAKMSAADSRLGGCTHLYAVRNTSLQVACKSLYLRFSSRLKCYHSLGSCSSPPGALLKRSCLGLPSGVWKQRHDPTYISVTQLRHPAPFIPLSKSCFAHPHAHFRSCTLTHRFPTENFRPFPFPFCERVIRVITYWQRIIMIILSYTQEYI